MITFSDKVTIGKAKVGERMESVSEDWLETLMVGAIEGGINYWACLRNDHPDFANLKPKDEPLSTWSTKLLIEGKSVYFCDREDPSEQWELTLPKILKGYELNWEKWPRDGDVYDGDAVTYDRIIQYAMFGELVYG